VKLTVKKPRLPRLDWGGVSHKDVGTLVDITNRYDSLGENIVYQNVVIGLLYIWL